MSDVLTQLLEGEANDVAVDRLRLAQAYYDQSLPPSLYYGGAAGDPRIAALVPNHAVVGSAAAVVAVNGSNFAVDAAVEVEGIAQTTTHVDASHLTISYTPPDVGEFVFTVRNVGTSLESNDVVFTGTATTAEDQPLTQDDQAEQSPGPAPTGEAMTTDNIDPQPEVPEGRVMGVDPPAGGAGPRARKPRNGNGGAR